MGKGRDRDRSDEILCGVLHKSASVVGLGNHGGFAPTEIGEDNIGAKKTFHQKCIKIGAFPRKTLKRLPSTHKSESHRCN